MPEDKDFKRVVRARMADTGTRYTAARAELRPDPADPAPDQAGPGAEAGELATVRPVDRAGLLAWRQSGPPPAPGAPREVPAALDREWELAVWAGGDLDVLAPAAVALTAVAALGSRLGGVGAVELVHHVDLPAPPGVDPDAPPPRPAPLEGPRLLHQVHRARQEYLAAVLGDDLPPLARARSSPAVRRGAAVVVPASSTTTILMGGDEAEVLGDHLDTDRWRRALAGRPGRLSVSFGAVLVLEAAFPAREPPVSPPPGRLAGAWGPMPIVPVAFWDGWGTALLAAAATAGLPAWPLHHGWLMGRSRVPAAGYSWSSSPAPSPGPPPPSSSSPPG